MHILLNNSEYYKGYIYHPHLSMTNFQLKFQRDKDIHLRFENEIHKLKIRYKYLTKKF